VLTLRGELGFARSVYECPRCRQSEGRMDRELGVREHEHMTRRVVKKVAYEVSGSSCPSASKKLAHQAELEVSVAECARVADQYGPRLDAMQREREEDWVRPYTDESPPAAPEFQAQRLVVEADGSPDFEVIAEVSMPIRMRGHDKTCQETQSAGSERALGSVAAATTACYTDRKPKFRILQGSI